MEDAVATGVSLFTIWGLRVLSAVLVMTAGWLIGKWLSNTIHKIKKLDKTLQSFLGGLAKYAVLAVALVTVLGQFGIQTASLLAVLGAAGLAIGLALQGTLSNVAAGVMILILRPFGVGDTIQYGSITATIKSLGLFGCELSTADNVYIYSPNSAIWNSTIYNFSRNKQRRQDIVVGISYKDDINKAFKTIQKILDKEKRILTTKGKEPLIVVEALGASSVNLKVRIWSEASDYWALQWDTIKAIKEALDKDGISIPFPTTTIEYAAGSAPEASSKKKAA